MVKSYGIMSFLEIHLTKTAMYNCGLWNKRRIAKIEELSAKQNNAL